MIDLVEQRLDSVRAACQRHGVARLELFGSAANASTFDPAQSDVDFIVQFHRGFDLGPWMAHYFALRDELADLFRRHVDLVMEPAMRSDIFRQEAAQTRELIYATPDSAAA